MNSRFLRPLARALVLSSAVIAGSLGLAQAPLPGRETKAGSVLEDDDQQGLAHFVEHMQFEGTTHFPGQGITDFLSSLGLSIGADANAATSFDETQYTLRVPT